MNAHYSTVDEAATPEYVLSVIRDMHRQQCQTDTEADPEASLSFDSTVAEWRDACDLLGWRKLGRAYNKFWGISCSDAQWRAVLEPARQKRLAGVCELIARSARRPLVRPARLLGRACTPAGAFLTVRSLLEQAGASAEQISPSTPLAPYTRRYVEMFLGPISRLAPGALPLIRVRSPVYDAAFCGFMAGLAITAAGACGGLHLLTIAGVLISIAGYALTWISARKMSPASVEFGDLRTFRDLATVIAGASAVEPDGGSESDGPHYER